MKSLELKDIKPIVFIVIVLILTVISAYPQRKLGGTITEVIDGKTFVMQTASGKVTGVLQDIEIPEPEQPLRQTVKDHLEKLIVNQFGAFKPLGVMSNQMIGQLMINGVDISQQMLRDGAAWYAVSGKTVQNPVYLDNESQAKAEKRGVWGIENLKPAWEFRAEKEKTRRQEEQATSNRDVETASVSGKPVKQKRINQPLRSYDNQSESWQQFEIEKKLPPGVKLIGGLLVAQDPSGRLGIIGTPPFKLNVVGNKDVPEMTIGIVYLRADDGERGMREGYFVSIESESAQVKFLKNNNLIITTENGKINIGKVRRTVRETSSGFKEILTYEIKSDVIEKVANAENVKWQVGVYQGSVGSGIQKLLKNMITATTR